MLSCAGADRSVIVKELCEVDGIFLFRLQTGMRGAWGKPYGTVARVNIGQVILSIRCKDANAPVIQEALRRARYKFPGRQKIIVSKKWGFTNVNKEDYLKLKAEKRVIQCVYFFRLFFFCHRIMIDVGRRDGAYVQFIRPKGPLETNLRTQLRA